MESPIRKLLNENTKLKKEIDEEIGLENPNYSGIWVKINKLVDNKTKMERYCNR